MVFSDRLVELARNQQVTLRDHLHPSLSQPLPLLATAIHSPDAGIEKR
jgi:hypothetical protein